CRRLTRIFAAERADIVHTHFTKYDVAAWCASRMLGRRAPSVIWHAHSAFPAKPHILRNVKDVVKMSWMGRSAHVVAASESLRQIFEQRMFPATRISVVHNG